MEKGGANLIQKFTEGVLDNIIQGFLSYEQLSKQCLSKVISR